MIRKKFVAEAKQPAKTQWLPTRCEKCREHIRVERDAFHIHYICKCGVVTK